MRVVTDPKVGWPQALAWRLRRQSLAPGVAERSVADVVRLLGAVPAEHAPELATGVRRGDPRPGDVARALASGEVISTFAFRGATHLLTPSDGAAFLALRAASRMWELPSWQSYYGLAPQDWPRLRAAVREALGDGPLTHDELGAALTARPEYRHLESAFAAGAWTLLKPLAWQGDLCLGPGGTFQRLDGNPLWAGLPELEDAGRYAVESYVRAYGPTTPDHLYYWLGAGLGAGRRRIRSWLDSLASRFASVDVEGTSAIILREDLDELRSTPATTDVRLLPKYDQWVLGPGTADAHVVPPGVRGLVSKGANLVLVGGVVSGTWSQSGDDVRVEWFLAPQPGALGEVERLAVITGRPLRLVG